MINTAKADQIPMVHLPGGGYSQHLNGVREGFPGEETKELNATLLLSYQVDSGAKARRERNPWGTDETIRLIVGVLRYGAGKWSIIHCAMGFDGKRTFTDLKDKWRNLLDPRCNRKTPIRFKIVARTVSKIVSKSEYPTTWSIPDDLFSITTDYNITFSDLERLADLLTPQPTAQSQISPIQYNFVASEEEDQEEFPLEWGMFLEDGYFSS